jgi:hypothetical protein
MSIVDIRTLPDGHPWQVKSVISRMLHWVKTMQRGRPDVNPGFYLLRKHSAGFAHPILALSEELQARYQLPNLRFNVMLPAKSSRRRKRLQRPEAFGVRATPAQLETSAFDRIVAQVIADVDAMTQLPSRAMDDGSRGSAESFEELENGVGDVIDFLVGQPRVYR